MKKLNFIDLKEMTPVFGQAEAQKICEHLKTTLSTFLKNEFFELESGYTLRADALRAGAISTTAQCDQVQIRLILRNTDKTFFYPVEAVFVCDDSSEDEMDAEDIGLIILDYLAIYFEEFLSNERNVFLPIDWSVHQYDEFSFFLRGFVRNLSVEKMAGEFLAKHGHGEHSIEPISAEY